MEAMILAAARRQNCWWDVANISLKVQKAILEKDWLLSQILSLWVSRLAPTTKTKIEHWRPETDTEQSALLQTGSLQLLYVLFLIKISVKKCSVGNSCLSSPSSCSKWEKKNIFRFSRELHEEFCLIRGQTHIWVVLLLDRKLAKVTTTLKTA